MAKTISRTPAAVLSTRWSTGYDVGALILRLGAAVIFIAHSVEDVFVNDMAGNIAGFEAVGIPLATLAAPFTTYMQFLGGIALLCGALTRLVSLGLLVVMSGAVVFVHFGEPLVMQPDGTGAGFAVMMAVASATLLLTGSGRFSLDWVLSAKAGRP